MIHIEISNHLCQSLLMQTQVPGFEPNLWIWHDLKIRIQGTDTEIWHVMWDEWKPLMCLLCSSYSYLRPQRTTLQSASHPDKNLWHGTRSQAPSKDIVWQHLCVHPHLDWRKPDSVGHLWGISWNFMQNILEREDLTVLGNHQCFAMWCFCAHQCGTGSEFSWDNQSKLAHQSPQEDQQAFLQPLFALLSNNPKNPSLSTIEVRIAKVTTAHAKGDFSHHRQFEQHSSLKMWHDMMAWSCRSSTGRIVSSKIKIDVGPWIDD